MKTICFYFQIHQPFRLKRYRFFDIGNDHYYYDDFQNEEIIRRIAENCYLPANKTLLEMIKTSGGKFKAAFSISGVALEQMEIYTPEVIDSFKELAATGNVVRHAEQLVDNKLAKEHRGCNNNAKAYQQQPSRPTEMIESEGQKHGYKQYCDKRALKSFFYYGCFHTSAKIAIKLEITY